MNKELASVIAEKELGELRLVSYELLKNRLKNPESKWVVGPDGQMWGVEINVFWDDFLEKKNLRVMVAVDDGSSKARMSPLTRDTIIGPSGEVDG